MPTPGERFADAVAAGVGSWTFILVQSLGLGIWITLNVIGVFRFDLFPFVLLNLLLSFEAAYTAPFILMSQGRQSAIDRATLDADMAANIEEIARLDRIEIRLQEHLELQMDQMLEKISALITRQEKYPTEESRPG